MCAIADGRLADAEDELGRLDRVDRSRVTFGGDIFGQVCRAELVLVRGDHAAGLRIHRDCVVRMREIELPGNPQDRSWSRGRCSASRWRSARTRFYATGDDVAHGRALYLSCRASALRVLGAGGTQLDYPVVGLLLFALGTWGLLRRAAPAPDAVRLLALADRFCLHQDDPDDDAGADRAGGRGIGAGPARRAARPSTPTAARRTCWRRLRRLAERLPS